MQRWVAVVAFLIVVLFGIWWLRPLDRRSVVSPVVPVRENHLDKYTIDNLHKRAGKSSQITLDDAIATTSAYTAYLFHFTTGGKKVTGLAHLPRGKGPFPVIVQLRGYVDREKYTSGEGTFRSSEVFATNGFLTLAPDFLGYGRSEEPSNDIFEERFQTYTTVLDLLASISTLPPADQQRVGIWGHSNGGQIALTILEILQKSFPTVLWAPVSKPFPYSILYYTDELSDHGKLLRRSLAKFEQDYDVELYSIPNYLDRIAAPVQIHQGSADEEVPQRWSDELADALKKKGKDVTYFRYPGADHNLQQSWNIVMSRDISFFREKLK